MTLYSILLNGLEPVKNYSTEIKDVSTSIDTGVKVITAMAGIILGLIGWIWNYTVRKHGKTEDKVDKLTDQVTRIATIVEVLAPAVKENSEKINNVQLNCAQNGHGEKTRKR